MSSSGALTQEGHVTIRAGQEEPKEIIQGPDHLSSEERLRELGLLSLKEISLQGKFRASFQDLKWVYRRAGEGHFTKDKG